MPKPAISLLALLLPLACTAPGPQPLGESSATVLALEAQGWVSQDTLISIDPLTGEQTLTTRSTDRRPDTLRDGSLVYQLSEYLPVFGDCTAADADADVALCTQANLNEFVRANLRYPQWAKARGLQGGATVSFTVGADGRVRNTAIERSLGDGLDQEVLRMVDRMPAWHPGFHDGHAVAVRYRLPVSFALAADQ